MPGGDRAACLSARRRRSEPPSPPYVMVVHPDQASTQIVLADTFQTTTGRRTYRPVQYLMGNGQVTSPGPSVKQAMIDAGLTLCGAGVCTSSCTATCTRLLV